MPTVKLVLKRQEIVNAVSDVSEAAISSDVAAPQKTKRKI